MFLNENAPNDYVKVGCLEIVYVHTLHMIGIVHMPILYCNFLIAINKSSRGLQKMNNSQMLVSPFLLSCHETVYLIGAQVDTPR